MSPSGRLYHVVAAVIIVATNFGSARIWARAPQSQLDQQENLIEEFLKQAPLKWREYLSFCERVQGTILARTKRFKNGVLEDEYRQEYETKRSLEGSLFRYKNETGGEQI